MKIAISAKSKDFKSEIDPRFGRCPYFFIFDTDTNSYEIVENDGANAVGGAGTAASQLINKYGVKSVISGDYGPHAVAALKSFGIKMYISSKELIHIVYDKFKNNLLVEMK